MTTAVDTNVFAALLRGTAEEAGIARRALRSADAAGALVVSPPVYAELAAAPGGDAEALDTFLERAGVRVDWAMGEDVWREAARAYGGYAERRRAQPDNRGPRRILADFIVGAHALLHASALLTFDRRLYRAGFPNLRVLLPE
ncbi:MAG: type II toxin-antitoxin system VapC family toxin [Rubrobacter sp.]|nr:type II toxin-antitoxin system VapC family toxin [Rubrobacter sp.]